LGRCFGADGFRAGGVSAGGFGAEVGFGSDVGRGADGKAEVISDTLRLSA
jgi:hypothetical protein